MPSVSAPNWSIIITGLPPEETGINSNDWTPERLSPKNYSQLELPPVCGKGVTPDSFWTVAKKQNPQLTTGVSISWDWINYLVDETTDHICRGHDSDDIIRKDVLDTIKNQKLPNLFFIHLQDVDHNGHVYGWGSKQYYQAVLEFDKYIGEFLETIKSSGYGDNTTLILISDHGGWQHHHDFFNQDSFYVPIIFYGNRIKKNYDIPHSINNLNLAPTILELMGLNKGIYMVSEAIKDIII